MAKRTPGRAPHLLVDGLLHGLAYPFRLVLPSARSHLDRRQLRENAESAVN